MAVMPQIQGDRGWSCSRLPRTLGNEGDPRGRDFASLKAHSSAFPSGKQNRFKTAEFMS